MAGNQAYCDALEHVREPLAAQGLHAGELLTNMAKCQCTLRQQAIAAPWLKNTVFFHPPTAHNYVPQPLPEIIKQKVKKCLK